VRELRTAESTPLVAAIPPAKPADANTHSKHRLKSSLKALSSSTVTTGRSALLLLVAARTLNRFSRSCGTESDEDEYLERLWEE
jgi:hypothetical protein